MAEKRLDIIIAARNQLNAGFSAAMQQLGSFNRSVNAATGTGLQNMLNIVGGIGKLRIGVDAARLAVAAMQGDFLKADEVVQRLPFGIGAAYQSAKELGLELTGWGREIKAAEAELQELDKQLAASQQRLQASRKLWGAPALGDESTETKIMRNLELSALSAAEQAVKALQYAAREAQDQLFNEWQAAGAHNPERFMRLWNAVTQTFENKIREVRAKQRADDEREAQGQAEKLRKQEESRIEAATRAEEQLKQTRLRLLGDELGAEKARLEMHYRERIAAAQSAAEIMALREQEAMEGIDLERRRRMAELDATLKAPRTQAATLLGERYGGLAAQQRAAHEERRRQKEAEIAEYAKRQVAALDDIRRTLKEGGERLYVLRLN